MKKIIIVFFLCVFNISLKAISDMPVNTNDNHTNLKFKFKVIKHYDNSKYYLAEIIFENVGSRTVSFLENINNYSRQLSFTTGGVMFVHNNSYEFISKYKTELPPQPAYISKVEILPKKQIKKNVMFYIFNKKAFVKNSKNLRVEFLYYDINIDFYADVYRPRILSENVVNYNW
jgi:hypothetical protein